ncbi:MAG: heavy metal translocating P-type ATPase [Candidatus Woesearchaeota archaeon]
MQKTEFQVSGMHCASCAAIIDRALQKTPGVLKSNVNYANANALVVFDESKVDEHALIQTIKRAGYGAETVGANTAVAQEERQRYEYQLTKAYFYFGLLFAIPAFIIGMVLMWFGIDIPYKGFILLLLATPVQFVVGWQFYRGAFHALRNKTANMDTLIAVGTSAAYFYSLYAVLFEPTLEQYFEISAILITLVMMGKLLEARAKGKTSEAIKKLMSIAPKTARIIRNGKESVVDIEEVRLADIIVIKPGDRIPVDGKLVDGNSSVDESMVTGESIPVEKRKGDFVYAGTINKNGSFRFSATKVGKDTTLSRIIQLIREAQGTKAPIQRFADMISAYFVPIVIGLALLNFGVWLLLMHSSISFALITSVAVLVIACPCALGLATPTAIMVGVGKGAQNGILIRGGEALETAQKLKYIVLDKTGAITKGTPELTDITPFSNNSPDYVLSLAASLEKDSEHPLADAIVKAAAQKKLRTSALKGFKATPGMGVSGKVQGKQVYLGNQKLMHNFGIPTASVDRQAVALEQEGKTVMFVAVGKKIIGLVAVADSVKDNSAKAITALKSLGLQVYMITGDNERTAKAVASRVGITNVFAGVLPEDKVNYVKELQKKGKVAMVGDGINDAPALAQADIGIAMGSGTDVAMETGNIVLMKNDLLDVPRAIRLSKLTMSKIRQNMFWALIYNTLGIPVAAGLLYPFTGWLLSPVIAGAAMALSSVSVVTNSLLLKAKRI